jgi:hypothetical protein
MSDADEEYSRKRRSGMATQPAMNKSDSITTTTSFDRFAGVCAIITGIGSLLYGVSFIVLHMPDAPSGVR